MDMEAVGPALPVCSFCGYPNGIGTFSNDRKAYICVGCQAVAKEFLDITASFYGQGDSATSEGEADRSGDDPGNGSPI
jgi:hypothetical protein